MSIRDIRYGDALTDFEISDSGPRMGRPPLKENDPTRKLLLRLPQSLWDRIDAIVGKKHRSKFIRDAVEIAVARHESGLQEAINREIDRLLQWTDKPKDD